MTRSPVRLEIQVHPADIRRGVRYFFLGTRQLWTLGALLALFLVFVGTAAVLAPQVLRNAVAERDYERLIHRRAVQGERLEALIGRFEELAAASADLRIRMSKIYLAYGLSTEESIGQGGFPFEAASAPDSIYSERIDHGGSIEARVTEEMRVLETFLAEVQSFEAAHAEQTRETPSLSPLRGADFVLTSPFGTRRSPFTKELDFHAGIDLAASTGAPIFAPADGVVVYAGRYPLRQSVSWWRYGNLVALRHGDRFVALFGHCSEVKVRNGQKVRQGEVIATVGSTGWSTSPHLHYEIRRLRDDGGYQPVDPRIYILDHEWRDEERYLIRARHAPDPKSYQPLPRVLTR